MELEIIEGTKIDAARLPLKILGEQLCLLFFVNLTLT